MGVSTRFATVYPERCLELVRELEGYARERRLVGSFALLAASSVLNVPFERAKAKHFLHRGQDDVLTANLDSLDRVSFVDAPFWEGEPPGDWRMTRILENWNEVSGWRDGTGQHPLARGAANEIGKKPASLVMRALRNALAHGNIIHLNADGEESEGSELHYLALLSRYEEGREAQEKSESYRLIVTTEDEFLRLVKAWAAWIARFSRGDRDIEES